MQILPIDNLLDNDYFDLDRSKEELSPAEREIIRETKVGLSFLFEDQGEIAIESFLRYFLTELLAPDRPIYLFFSEPFLSPVAGCAPTNTCSTVKRPNCSSVLAWNRKISPK